MGSREQEEAGGGVTDEQWDDFNEYQEIAHSTAIYPKKYGLHYSALALAGEAGEYAGKVSKVYRDHDGILTEEMHDKLVDELCDVAWTLAEAATVLGVPLSKVIRRNVKKLADRKARGVLGGSGDNR